MLTRDLLANKHDADDMASPRAKALVGIAHCEARLKTIDALLPRLKLALIDGADTTILAAHIEREADALHTAAVSVGAYCRRMARGA